MVHLQFDRRTASVTRRAQHTGWPPSTFYAMTSTRWQHFTNGLRKDSTTPRKLWNHKVAIIGGAKNGEGKLAFECVRVTESPLTANLSDDDLYHIFDSPLKCDYPCHSQSVEHVLLYSKLSIYRTLAMYLHFISPRSTV